MGKAAGGRTKLHHSPRALNLDLSASQPIMGWELFLLLEESRIFFNIPKEIKTKRAQCCLAEK